MKSKPISLVVIFTFLSSSVFAQSAGTFVFSGFGGAMPASAINSASIALLDAETDISDGALSLSADSEDPYSLLTDGESSGEAAFNGESEEADASYNAELADGESGAVLTEADDGTAAALADGESGELSAEEEAEKAAKRKKIIKNVLIVTGVVAGTALVVGGVYLIGKAAAESCANSCGESISSSVSDSVSSGSCSSQNLASVLTNELALIPVFTP